MNSLISSILLWHVVIVTSKSINTTTANNTATKELELQIDALEKEKDELLNKINVAIDEGVKALERVNDSDSTDGRQYLMELKNQIKELDEADSDESDEKNATSSENHINENATDEFRRFGERNQKDPKSFIIERIQSKKRNKQGLAFMQTAQHLKVEKDIRDWIAMKNEEKRKIKEYRLKRKLVESYYEICPRFGEKGKKKNQKSKSSKKKKKEGNDVQGRYRPCCRKCCKKSYLGCL